MPRRLEPEPYASKVGARVRDLRLERNLSLAELADASALSKGHLSSIEHGLAAITVQTIMRLAKGLEVSPLYVLTFPSDSDHDQVMELVRKLASNDVVKIRRDLTKAAKESAKAAKSKK